MSELLYDSFKRLFLSQGKSEKEAEIMAAIASEPPVGYRWSKANAKPKAETDGRFYEGKPKLSRAEVDARFYQVKRGGGERIVELREQSGCVVTPKVAR